MSCPAIVPSGQPAWSAWPGRSNSRLPHRRQGICLGHAPRRREIVPAESDILMPGYHANDFGMLLLIAETDFQRPIAGMVLANNKLNGKITLLRKDSLNCLLNIGFVVVSNHNCADTSGPGAIRLRSLISYAGIASISSRVIILPLISETYLHIL